VCFNFCIFIWMFCFFFTYVFVQAVCGCSCSRSPINTKMFCLDFEFLILGLKGIWFCFRLNYFFLLFEENTIKSEARSFFS